jgi:hypothetical protein
MPPRRYQVRVRGRLSPRVRNAFPGMEVVEAPVETVIGSTIGDVTQLSTVLSLIDSLGLQVVAVDQVASDPVVPAPRRPPDGE